MFQNILIFIVLKWNNTKDYFIFYLINDGYIIPYNLQYIFKQSILYINDNTSDLSNKTNKLFHKVKNYNKKMCLTQFNNIYVYIYI